MEGPGGERTGPSFFAQFFLSLALLRAKFLKSNETRIAVALWALNYFIQWPPMENKVKRSLINDKEPNDRSKEIIPPTFRKVKITKDSVKSYRVTVHYLIVTEEEAHIKKAIIESIMKKNHSK
ncbi:hypothetical protein HH214_10575 [Mucilaginibacter robiniae]|uniref:Uncharacterized protein n=1 Tax=Mucilaginibacter robiniae TaxID=2728022 RepID=A0A7L5DZ51_9SPHI|nr:hypothetical protein [Mucilaginibacter robiniae]QJD96275.1 hypothetical protein HH214_10575 [Mucilaginibacter robiniae]